MRSLLPYALSLLRMVAGFTFALHGFQKLFGYFGGMGGGTAHFYSLLWLAGSLETAGGILIVLGLWTSPVAFLLCGEMAVAYFKGHYPKGYWPITNGGELAVLKDRRQCVAHRQCGKLLAPGIEECICRSRARRLAVESKLQTPCRSRVRCWHAGCGAAPPASWPPPAPPARGVRHWHWSD